MELVHGRATSYRDFPNSCLLHLSRCLLPTVPWYLQRIFHSNPEEFQEK
jgi:hypothetical protein